jgi:hypothetical protein
LGEAVDSLTPNIEDGELDLEKPHAIVDADKLKELYKVLGEVSHR